MQLNSNVGTADRVIRVLVGIAMLSAVVLVDGRERWLGLIGVVPIVTAFVRFCPLYAVLGIRTGAGPIAMP